MTYSSPAFQKPVVFVFVNINFALILVPKAVYMDVPCSIILRRDHKQNDLCGFSCLTEAITLTLSNKLVVFTFICYMSHGYSTARDGL